MERMLSEMHPVSSGPCRAGEQCALTWQSPKAHTGVPVIPARRVPRVLICPGLSQTTLSLSKEQMSKPLTDIPAPCLPYKPHFPRSEHCVLKIKQNSLSPRLKTFPRLLTSLRKQTSPSREHCFCSSGMLSVTSPFLHTRGAWL